MFSRSGIDRLVLGNYVIEKEQVGMGKAMDSAGRKLGIMQEVMAFLWERKLWWLMPMVLTLLLFGMLIIFAESSPVAPFIYTLF